MNNSCKNTLQKEFVLAFGRWVFLFLIFIFSNTIVFSQDKKQIEIIQAGSLEGVKINGIEVRRLVGDVIFKQEDTYMYCDSALFYESTNSIDAYGTIRIEGPRAKLYGDFLHYDGNFKSADITGKVVRMTDGKMDLTTTAMQYDLENDIGNYQVGGKVIDKDNVLTSKKGYYYSKERMIFFKEDVVLTNPRYVMFSDTLKYHTPSSVAYFFGPSHIYSSGTDSAHIYCENGWYNTKTEKSRFSKNAFIESKENRLSGDSLSYDRLTKLGEAWNHVELKDTVQKVIIGGDYAWLDELNGISFVTGNSLLTKMFDVDSLFLHADTLYAKQDTAAKQKTYFAYHHVRIFKTDLQGQCDSLVYSSSDSTIWFYTKPILWSNNNQMTADKISLLLVDNEIKRMNLYANSFIAGIEDSLRFNQIKGREMIGYFIENKLNSISVNGNGQSIYYIRNKKKQITGVNQADCSDMLIRIKENRVSKISLIKNADATLFPVKETDPKQMRLKDFSWKGHLQPLQKSDVFNWLED